jgi:hypothetical protein
VASRPRAMAIFRLVKISARLVENEKLMTSFRKKTQVFRATPTLYHAHQHLELVPLIVHSLLRHVADDVAETRVRPDDHQRQVLVDHGDGVRLLALRHVGRLPHEQLVEEQVAARRQVLVDEQLDHAVAVVDGRPILQVIQDVAGLADARVVFGAQLVVLKGERHETTADGRNGHSP